MYWNCSIVSARVVLLEHIGYVKSEGWISNLHLEDVPEVVSLLFGTSRDSLDVPIHLEWHSFYLTDDRYDPSCEGPRTFWAHALTILSKLYIQSSLSFLMCILVVTFLVLGISLCSKGQGTTYGRWTAECCKGIMIGFERSKGGKHQANRIKFQFEDNRVRRLPRVPQTKFPP